MQKRVAWNDNVALLLWKRLVGRRRLKQALVVAVIVIAVSLYLLRSRGELSEALREEQRSILLCEQNQENMKDFTEIAYKKLGLQIVMVEPKLLELVQSLEAKRDMHITNRTKLYGHPDVTFQNGEKVLTWYHRDGGDTGKKKKIHFIVDYSLPLTVFGSPRTVCNQWRTSFAVFYKDGAVLLNGTKVAKLSWQLADLSEAMKNAGFSVAVFDGDDPRLVNAAVGVRMRSTDPLLLHMRFFRGKHNIYVTVLYERSEAGHYWHSSLLTDNGKSPVHFGFRAGSLKQFGSRTVNLDFGVRLAVPENLPDFLEEFSNSRFIECNTARADRFFRSFPQTEVTSEEMTFVISAKKALRLGRIVLDKLKVPFWISSGTCLGWFRQCSIIPHSKDVDLGIFITDFSEHIVMHMLLNGFKLTHRFGLVNDSLELSFMLDGVKLDFFFFYEEPTSMWNGGTQARTGKKFKYIFPKFSLCWTEFVGLRVRVPCQTQSYIEANYGLTWDQPVKEWNWKASPPNVRPNGAWNASDWSKVIQLY